MPQTTRREALVAIAAASAAPALDAQQHQHAPETPVPATPYRFKALTDEQLEALKKLVDLIIPPTDTPGAVDAGVPEYIDRRMAVSAPLAENIRKGLTGLDSESQQKFGASFLSLNAGQAAELLTPLSQFPLAENGRFFRLIKDMTVDGYYTSRAGLVEELGWHGNTYLSEFKGCTHPEHQS